MLKRWTAWPQGIRRLVGGIAAVVLALAIAWALLVPGADWLARQDVASAKGPLLQTARDAARGRLLTLAAGLFAVGALWYTARNFTLSREGQVTDRYTKAIEQLGSGKLDVQIGGIYALERVARDSARDRPTVMEVLAAFIREHSLEQWPPSDPGAGERARSTRPDVQAAVTVVGRRDAKRDMLLIDLTGAHLRGATLTCAHLDGADLTRAHLDGADLTRAHLRRAYFFSATLTGAILIRADLRGADLRGADLDGADLSRADLRDAVLTGTNPTRADLIDPDLIDADYIDADHIDAATFTAADLTGAWWPGDALVPPGWKLDTGSGRLRESRHWLRTNRGRISFGMFTRGAAYPLTVG